MNKVEVLQERAQTHGDFGENAAVAQRLRDVWRLSRGWATMPDVQREALDMIACKLSRILSGHSRYADHWLDIAGYATLAERVCDE